MAYRVILSCLLTTLLVSPATSLAAPSRHDQYETQIPLSSQLNATFRDMTESDLADFTTIVIDAFAPGPDWQYLMPDLPKHRSELWHCFYQQAIQQWHAANRSAIFGKIITVPVTEPAGQRDRAVSLAVWKVWAADEHFSPTPAFHTTARAMLETLNCSPPTGVNVTRQADLSRQTEAAMQKYFYGVHEKRLYLQLLATHPEWDGNGFAARHLDWGMEFARELDVPVALFATAAGWPLYDSVGFESVKNVTLTMLDGLGTFWQEVMRWTH